jgi:hypothetical protein
VFTSEGTKQGLKTGLAVAADTYSGGLYSSKAYSHEIGYEGAAFLASVSREAAIMAATTGLGKAYKAAKAGKELKLYHYTNESGARGIVEAGMKVKTGFGGRVWATNIPPEKMRGVLGVVNRVRIGGGLNVNFGGRLGLKFSVTRLNYVAKIQDVAGFTRAGIDKPLGAQFYKVGEALAESVGKVPH